MLELVTLAISVVDNVRHVRGQYESHTISVTASRILAMDVHFSLDKKAHVTKQRRVANMSQSMPGKTHFGTWLKS